MASLTDLLNITRRHRLRVAELLGNRHSMADRLKAELAASEETGKSLSGDPWMSPQRHARSVRCPRSPVARRS